MLHFGVAWELKFQIELDLILREREKQKQEPVVRWWRSVALPAICLRRER